MLRIGEVHTVAAAARISVIVPSPTKLATLLQNNKILSFVPSDEVDRHADA